MYFANRSKAYGDLYVPACTVALGSPDRDMLTTHGLAATSVSVDLELSMSGTFSFSIPDTFDAARSEFLPTLSVQAGWSGFTQEYTNENVLVGQELSRAQFSAAAARWLTGSDPFTAKLQPKFARYGDYDQLMRLEEWLGRS